MKSAVYKLASCRELGEHIPNVGDKFLAFHRDTGRPAPQGPFLVTKVMNTSVNGLDDSGNDRIFRAGSWVFREA